MFKRFIQAFRVSRQIMRYLDSLENSTIGRFSVENAIRDRHWIEQQILAAYEKRDEGLFGLTQCDEAFVAYLADVLQSPNLRDLIGGSSLQRTQARERILAAL